MMNLLPHLRTEDRSRALYHGLSAVSRDTAGQPPRSSSYVHYRPRRWIWLRSRGGSDDSSSARLGGAERCIVSAVRAGADHALMADMLFSAATDHRYLDSGHVLDFTNKAFEALDVAGWSRTETVLSSLAEGYVGARRMEESNSWRNPVDLVEILEDAFERLPNTLEETRAGRGRWEGREELAAVLLEEEPKDIAEALLGHLREGASEEELAGAVAYAAALRMHAVSHHQRVRGLGHRVAHLHLLERRLPGAATDPLWGATARGLRRCDERPPRPLPQRAARACTRARRFGGGAEELLAELPVLLDERQRVDEAGKMVAGYLYSGGETDRLLAVMGGLLLGRTATSIPYRPSRLPLCSMAICVGPRSARTFWWRRRVTWTSPTMRSQGQTYDIARRLSRGEIFMRNERYGSLRLLNARGV